MHRVGLLANVKSVLKKMNLERVELATIYKQDNIVNIEFTPDAIRGFEIYGFLKCLVDKMEKELTESLEDK